MAGVGAVALNSALIWPLLGRSLARDEFGQLVQVLAMSALLGPVLTVGMHAFVLRYLVSVDRSSRDGAAAVATAGARMLMIVTAFEAALWLADVDVMIVAFATAQATAILGAAIARGDDRPFAFAYQAFTAQVLPLILILSAAALGHASTDAFTLAFLIASPLSMIACVDRLLAGRWPSHREWSRAVGFSIPLIPHLVLAVGLLQVARFLVGSLNGAAAVAEFQFAALLGGAGITVIQAAMAHMTTDALRSKDDFDRRIFNVQRRGLWLSAAVAVGVAAFAILVLESWSPSYIRNSSLVWAVALLVLAFPGQVVGDASMATMMRAGQTMRVSISTAGGFLVAAAAISGTPLLSPELVTPAAAAAVTAGILTRAAIAQMLNGHGLSRRGGGSWPPWLVVLTSAFVLASLQLMGL